MAEGDDQRITCATYTHARRHPMVMGKVGDWTPPFQFSLAQIGVFLLVAFVQVQTWRYWGAHLPRVAGIVVFLVVPIGCAWAVRRARWEGRSLLRAVWGWVTFWSIPRRGVVAGRAYSHTRPRPIGHIRIYVASGPNDPAGQRVVAARGQR